MTKESNTPDSRQVEQETFNPAVFSAALAYYGLPADYKRIFSKGKVGLAHAPNPDQTGKRNQASWVQVNQPRPGAALDGTQPKKANNSDIGTILNLTLDFEYPADPGRAHKVGLELAEELVNMRLAEPGLPVEDSGAGCHIVIPVQPIDIADGQQDLYNRAIALLIDDQIKPVFEQLAEAQGLKGLVKLEAFDISRILSVPGTWRPGGAKPDDAAFLANGYLRQWLPPFDGDNYPARNESEDLSALIKALVINLDSDQEPQQATAQAGTGKFHATFTTAKETPSEWLENYYFSRKLTISDDRSINFHALMTACYLRFDSQTALELAEQIDQLTGGKYKGRVAKEAERSLRKAERLPKISRVDWYSSRGYQYDNEPQPGQPAGDTGSSVSSTGSTPPPPDNPPTASSSGDDQPIYNQHHTTDLGNAKRLVERFGQDLKYVSAWGWLVWDGKRWKIDKTGAAKRKAKKTVATIYTEAGQIENDDERKATADHAKKSEANGRLVAMLELAESEIEVVAEPQDFDTNPWLLNCRNGTLDLQTGQLHPHNRADMITKIIPVDYDPEAKCPLWLNFIDTIMRSSHEMTSFLQRAVGYSLTGQTSEQCLFFAYGLGANGKSVFLETLQNLFGDFAKATNANAFLAKDRGGDGPRNDIAALAGARFVKAVESESGRRWAEALIKEITGGDTIAARYLFKEEFTFKPVLKLWFAANHKPIVVGQDNGIWRRIRLIPFSVTIPPEQQDRKLPEKLKSELAGILTWAVMGCLAWQKTGLREPEAVLQATKDYREESDSLRDFIAVCCLTGKADKYHVTLSECYKRYSAWATENLDRPIKKHSFSQALGERGFLVKNGAKNQTTVYGLKLIPAGDTSQEDDYQDGFMSGEN